MAGSHELPPGGGCGRLASHWIVLGNLKEPTHHVSLTEAYGTDSVIDGADVSFPST
jgi:hypothetical protein